MIKSKSHDKAGGWKCVRNLLGIRDKWICNMSDSDTDQFKKCLVSFELTAKVMSRTNIEDF